MAKNASKDKSGAKKPEAVQAAKTVQAATADVAPVSVRSSAIHIGISDKDRAAISKGLSALLAGTYTLYLTTHHFHWNVTGPMFNTLHLMFEAQSR